MGHLTALANSAPCRH